MKLDLKKKVIDIKNPKKNDEEKKKLYLQFH